MRVKKINFIWCLKCLKKKPPIFSKSHKLVLARDSYYGLKIDGFTIDDRVMGLCEECLEKASELQKKSAIDVDVNHANLIKYSKDY